MAGRTKATDNTEIVDNIEPVASFNDEDKDMEKKVNLTSIAGWETGFNYIYGMGSAQIAPYGTVRISRAEIMAQVQNGNRLIGGTDMRGTHATLVTDDKVVKAELGFTDDYICEDTVRRIFNEKDKESFKRAFTAAVVTRAEKAAVMKIIGDLGINDYSKIRFAEDYTGIRI